MLVANEQTLDCIVDVYSKREMLDSYSCYTFSKAVCTLLDNFSNHGMRLGIVAAFGLLTFEYR